MPPRKDDDSTILARLDERTESMCERIEKMDHTLHGNGKEGLVVRVDRLEQGEARRTKLFWILVTAVVVSMTTLSTAVVKNTQARAGQQQTQGK